MIVQLLLFLAALRVHVTVPTVQPPDQVGTEFRQEAPRKVWVNTRSGVYHCPGTRYWGNTKSGVLLTEDAAKRAGHRPAYGRFCGLSSPESSAAENAGPLPLTTAAPADSSGSVRVWVNTRSGVFHCSGTRYYGTTKAGQFMTQAQAQRAGHRPAYGRSC
jgi:hypothetical protein